MSGTVREINEGTFLETLKTSNKLVVVEFYLTTCPNCTAIAPVYETLSKELQENAIFTKINAQENLGISSQYGIMSTPTFKFFCKERPIGELVGGVNETLLRNTIKDLIRHRSECISKSTKLLFEIDGYA